MSHLFGELCCLLLTLFNFGFIHKLICKRSWPWSKDNSNASVGVAYRLLMWDLQLQSHIVLKVHKSWGLFFFVFVFLEQLLGLGDRIDHWIFNFISFNVALSASDNIILFLLDFIKSVLTFKHLVQLLVLLISHPFIYSTSLLTSVFYCNKNTTTDC